MSREIRLALLKEIENKRNSKVIAYVTSDRPNLTWTNLNLACIESVNRFDILQTDLKVKRLKNIPPQVNLNLNNMALPPVNINNLPTNITAQQIMQILEQFLQVLLPPIINKAAKDAVDILLDSLPTAGFEQIFFNRKWKLEASDV